MEVIIMRGLPGAGKSTLIKKKYPKAIVFSTDRFFLKHSDGCRQTPGPMQFEVIGGRERIKEPPCVCTPVYKFDPSLLGEAHGRCLRQFIDEVQYAAGMLDWEKTNTEKAEFNKWKENYTIIVDNTNLSVAEIAPYMQVAQAYKLPVRVLTIECSLGVAFERNIHGVPKETILQMDLNLVEGNRSMPTWWDHSTYIEGRADGEFQPAH